MSLSDDQVKQAIPRALIATFDIETYSSQWKDGKFPEPDSRSDVIYALSYILSYSDSKETISEQCICILNHELRSRSGWNADPNRIIFVANEEELLIKFSSLVNESDPDIITGYNIFGYDSGYIEKRAELLGGLLNIGRLHINEDDRYENFVSKKWTGAGGTWHEYHYPEAVGRVVIDAYILASRMKVDYTSGGEKGKDASAKSHKLDDIGKFLVGEMKDDVPYKEQFRRYNNILALTNGKRENIYFENNNQSITDETILNEYKEVIDYCIQDSVFCMKVFYEMKGWIETRETASVYAPGSK